MNLLIAIKYLTQATSREEGLIWTHSGRHRTPWRGRHGGGNVRQLVTVPLQSGSERESYHSAIFSFYSSCNPSPWCGVTHKQGRSQLSPLKVCLLDGSKSSQVGSQFQYRAHSTVQVMLQTLVAWVPARLGTLLFISFLSSVASHPCYHPHITPSILTHCSNLHPRPTHLGTLIWLTHDVSPPHPTPDGSFTVIPQ